MKEDLCWIRLVISDGDAQKYTQLTRLHYDKVKKTVQNWIYSWMKQGCETLEEYQWFKYLLYEYLKSQTVVDKVSTRFYSNVELYLKKYIETHETNFLFSLRKHIRHYVKYSNTILEGYNDTLKYHSSSVTPQT